LAHYKEERVCYINVKPGLKEELRKFSKWVDLEPYIKLESEYEGLGVDRKALCLAIEEGVVVDAGSAVTVDVVKSKKHLGGFIFPGLSQMRRSYAAISQALDKEPSFSWEGLPKKTSEAIGYGMIRPLVLAIEELGEPLFVTGGDGLFLSRFLKNARYDELLIFKGLRKIKDGIC
jgi:type III pantothenate kinase